MKAVPSWAAAAPAASTAAMPRPVAIPPVATSGRSVAARTSWRSASRPTSPGRALVEGAAVPAGLHALHHQRVGARLVRDERLDRVVTVTQSAQPAACSASTSDRDGQPKVTDTTGTRSSATRASFSSQPSSS